MTAMYNSTDVHSNLSDFSLPCWLPSFLEHDLSATFEIMRQAVSYNLRNTPERNRKYLGTYFPRSFTEILTVGDSIVAQCPSVVEHFRNCETVRILSVGSGTGGDTAGAVEFLHRLNPAAGFEIHLVDGNRDALDKCVKILERQAQEEELRMRRDFCCRSVAKPADFGNIAASHSSLDLIITSKFLNELVLSMHRPYFNFVTAFAGCLRAGGVMLLTDVLCKLSDRYGNTCGEYIPYTMNRELDQYLSSPASLLKGLLPCSCSWCHSHPGAGCYKTRTANKYASNSKDFTYRLLQRI